MPNNLKVLFVTTTILSLLFLLCAFSNIKITDDISDYESVKTTVLLEHTYNIYNDSIAEQLQTKNALLSSKETISYIEHISSLISHKLKTSLLVQRLLFALGFALALSLFSTAFLYIRLARSRRYLEQLYNRAMNDANVGLAICDKDYNYEYANSQYLKLLKFETDSLVGKNVKFAAPQNIQEALMANNKTPLREETLVSFTHDGKDYYVIHRRFVIFDTNNMLKIVSVIQDYTENRRKDIALQEQLKKTEEAVNAKTSLIANVSHEIKTPLNVISGMVHILKGTSLTKNQANLLAKVESSTELLSNLINDMLNFSQLQRSSISLTPTKFNLQEYLDLLIKSYQLTLSEDVPEFVTSLDFPEDLCIYLDKVRLKQVILHLLDNAFKFTHKGSVTFSVSEKERREGAVLLEFSVKDTGIGIAPCDISKIFQDFEQVEGYLTKTHTGTGLGLSICKHIISLMAGNMWIESEKGVGSTFYFSLWCEIEDSLEIVPRILIVEDNELNYDVTKNMLEESNLNCDHAWDGQEAVDMCLKVAPDYYTAILMDIHMPTMDGYTAAEILRTEIGITSPIIAVTATNFDEKSLITYKGIIDNFVAKPFKYEDLMNALCPYIIEDTFTLDFISQGAKHLGATEELFVKHLGKFIATYKESDKEIEELFQQYKYEEAHRLAHSIKGLAGTLSLFDLQKKSLELETFLKPFALEFSHQEINEKGAENLVEHAENSTILEEFQALYSAYSFELRKVCGKRLPNQI